MELKNLKTTKNKIKNTNLKKYGVSHYSKSSQFKNKIKSKKLLKNTEKYKKRYLVLII